MYQIVFGNTELHLLQVVNFSRFIQVHQIFPSLCLPTYFFHLDLPKLFGGHLLTYCLWAHHHFQVITVYTKHWP